MRTDFHTAQAHIPSRDIGLVEWTQHGVTGWGEASPFPGQDESMGDLIGAAESGEWTPTLRAGLNQAESDLSARSRGVSLADMLGATNQSTPVSIAIGLGPDPASLVAEASSIGVSRFKVKIAPGYVDHVALIRAANESCVLGVDANGSFSGDSVEELSALAELDIAYIEQPCDTNDVGALNRIKRLVDAPVFADESVRSTVDAAVVLGSPLIDGVVVKPGRLGLDGALEMIGVAERFGKRWRASGLLETGVGRAYTDLLAAIPSAFVSDVVSADWFLERDVAPSRFSDGAIATPRGPGLGVVPDRGTVDRYLVATHEVRVT